MAYARKGRDCDVYLYKNFARLWICCQCELSPHHLSAYLSSYGDVGTHLLLHLARGHKVPDRTFDRLAKEMER